MGRHRSVYYVGDEVVPAPSSSSSSTRSLAELIIKLFTVHIVTTASYVYSCHLQKRNVRSWRDVIRLIFFIFTPTILFIEVPLNFGLALIAYLRDEADDEATNFRFHFSAALGMRATQKKGDDEEAKDGRLTKVPLMRLSCTSCDRKSLPITWSWVGQVFLATFTLAQGVGTIIDWAQRLMMNGSFGLDDRNAVMGIAITILSIHSLFILLLRSNWAVNQPLPPAQPRISTLISDKSIGLAFAALAIQNLIHSGDYNSLPNPTRIILWMLDPRDGIFALSPLLILLVVVFVVLRKEIIAKFGFQALAARFKARLGERLLRRLWGLTRVALVILIVSDEIVQLVADIVEVIQLPPSDQWNQEYWTQTSLSDSIPAL